MVTQNPATCETTPLLREQATGMAVARRAYTDPALFEREMAEIFEGGWIYLCHESQIPEHGDYYATRAGRQPVFVIRGVDGGVNAFIDACAHRGALLTRARRGRMRTIVCRFHGWCYNTEGACTAIKSEETGWAEGGADKSKFSLTPLARVASYGGFVFGSLKAGVPDLENALGAAKPFIDLVAGQSPDGMEVVRGGQTYLIHGNWKLQAENGVDGYHVGTVHQVFARAVAHRENRGDTGTMRKTEAGRIAGKVETGAYDIGDGHMMIWAGRANPEAAPLAEALPELGERFSEGQIDWMLRRGRNLFLFPNVFLMDQSSTQIRVLIPHGPERTEVRVYCIAPRGESRAARAARVRKFEDFFMVTGMATPDDLAALEDVQKGMHGAAVGWNPVERGHHGMITGADDLARTIGADIASASPSWENETLYYGFYRRWARAVGAAS